MKLPRQHYLCLLIFCGVLVGFHREALACSISMEYLRPSNYDLVKETDVIVLAAARSSRQKQSEDGYPLTFVTFDILETIKGAYDQPFIEIEGHTEYRGRTPEDDFSEPRAGAFSGACNAYDYRLGGRFLLFLTRIDNEWITLEPAFSRINEEVDGSQSPWVTTVRHYVRIATSGDNRIQEQALRDLQKQAEEGADPAHYPVALVADIDAYFATPYPTRSFSDLMAMYARVDDYSKNSVLFALAKSRNPEAAAVFHKLAASKKSLSQYPGPVGAYLVHSGDRTVLQLLMHAYPRLAKNSRWSVMWALIQRADQRDQAGMLQVLHSANEEEFTRLSAWFVNYPYPPATAALKHFVGQRYQERYKTAVSLATLGDKETFRWAKTHLRSPSEDQWIPYYLVAASPLAEADEVAQSIIRGDSAIELSYLVDGYGDSINPQKWQRLEQIVDLRSTDPALQAALKRTLVRMKKENGARAHELLERL